MPHASPDPPKPVIPAAEHGNPLSYEAPRDHLHRDPPLNLILATFHVLIAGAVSSAVIVFISAFLFMGVNDLVGVPGGEEFRIIHPAGSLAIGSLLLLGSAAASLTYWRSYRGPMRRDLLWWATIGVLLGVGVTCLLEGACFALGSYKP